MNYKTVKRNMARLQRQLARLTYFLHAPHTRIRVWLDGRQEGMRGMYGSPESFRKQLRDGRDSESVERVKRLAEVASAKAEQLFEHETMRHPELLPKVQERLSDITGRIDVIRARAGKSICHDPHVSPRGYTWLMVLFTVTEAVFSVPSLMWSGLGNTLEEVVLAVVAAIIIVLLCHFLGLDLRKFPLPEGSSWAHRAIHVIKTLFEAIILLGGLLVITFFRWRGMSEQNGNGSGGPDTSTTALFALGCAFAFAAVVSAYETEYSGPLFGLGRLKRQQRALRDLVTALEAAATNIVKIRENFARLIVDRVAALRAAHLRRYVKSWKPAKPADQSHRVVS